MNETAPSLEQRPADLRALHQQLEEVAARTKGNSDDQRNRAQVADGPVLVVRGK